jgi:hypothetical protein
VPILVPSGIVPIKSLTTDDVLYGDRVTSYRWEVLAHSSGSDHLVGFLDGVVEGSASLSWSSNAAVKGTGSMKVLDLDTAADGLMTISQLALVSARVRPVLVIDGLPDIPLGVFLFSAAPEAWAGTGRTYSAELLDRSTVLDQDSVDESYTVDATTPILQAVAAVIASAGESIDVDATVTDTLASPMVWEAGTSKLRIVNDLLAALNYNSLWVDGVGRFQATPYVVPAKRSLTYELLNRPRELIDGADSIYSDEWSRDLDMFAVPNKVVAVQSGSDGAPALVGEYTNTDPASPFSYPSRGRWITSVLTDVEVPDYSNEADPQAATVAFLVAKAQQSLIAASAVQATVKVKHLPVPLRVLDVMRFKNVPAGIDARHVVTSITLDANPLGLMETTLQEVIDL